MKPGSRAFARCVTGAALVFAAALAPSRAAAGTIGFRTDVEVTVGPAVDAKVTLTHTGDEAASSVRVRAGLLGRSVDGEEVAVVAPGQNHVWNLHVADQLPKGLYALDLRTRYTDDNGYPFEVLSMASATVGVTAAPRVFGNIDIPRLAVGGEVVAVVTAKKPAARSGAFEASLAVPDGIDVSPERVPLVFDESGKARAEFRLRNRRLLTGTSVNVFAIVRGQGTGFPQEDTIRGTVTIGAAVVKVTATDFYRVAGVLAALLFAMETGAWMRSRRTQDS